MPVLDVYNMQKEKVSEITLNDDVFSVPVREDVLHEVVTMQLAKRRAGTASTKSRSEVSGGGFKPGVRRARDGRGVVVIPRLCGDAEERFLAQNRVTIAIRCRARSENWRYVWP